MKINNKFKSIVNSFKTQIIQIFRSTLDVNFSLYLVIVLLDCIL